MTRITLRTSSRILVFFACPQPSPRANLFVLKNVILVQGKHTRKYCQYQLIRELVPDNQWFLLNRSVLVPLRSARTLRFSRNGGAEREKSTRAIGSRYAALRKNQTLERRFVHDNRAASGPLSWTNLRSAPPL